MCIYVYLCNNPSFFLSFLESELPVIIGNFLSGNYETVIADSFTTEVVGGDLEELLPSEIQALVLKNIDSLLSADPKR